MKRFLHILGSFLVLLIFLGAVWLLAKELRHYTFQEIVSHIRNTSARQIAAAIGLTVLSYVILVGYDFLAVLFVGQKLSLAKIALASFAGYAFSYNFGATLAGTSIRYRLYAGWDVPALKIVKLLVILGLTFWFGLFFLAGFLFLLTPLKIPRELLDDLNAQGAGLESWVQLLTTNFRIVGVVLLVLALGYIALAAVFHGRLRLFGKDIPVPPLGLTVYQYAIASADFVVAAAVLWVLLPPMDNTDFTRVMGVYILAYVAEVLTHVPGGWGVFELPLIYLLPADRGQLFAAVLLFRVIYRLVPVLIAALLFGFNELVLRRESLARLGRMLSGPNSPRADLESVDSNREN